MVFTDDLLDENSFSKLATLVAKQCAESDCIALEESICSQLEAVGANSNFSSNTNIAIRHFKLGMALGILVATKSKAEDQISTCKRTFGRLLSPDSTLVGESKNLLATEMCYMDQFVEGKTRDFIAKNFQHVFEQYNNTPAILDYLAAWEKLEQFNEFKSVFPVDKNAKRTPHAILILSAKGGTGKSTTTAAIAHYLSEKGKKVGIIDLDDSGPTAQYLFDVDEVTTSMNEIPRFDQKRYSEWCYPSFLDILDAQEEGSKGDCLDEVSNRTVLKSSDKPNLSLVLLPESPTLCARVATEWSTDVGQRVRVALSSLMRVLRDQHHCEYVVVDFAPGMYGTNGQIIKWFSMNCLTTPIVLTSSRASDIATSIYESPWLASKHEFEWATPLLHFINRWDYDEGPLQKILHWAENAIEATVKATTDPKNFRVSSATQIHSKRFWPIFYQYALDNTPDQADALFSTMQVLAELKEDRAIRQLSSLDKDPSVNANFKVDFKKLEKSDWYAQLTNSLNKYLKVK